MTQASKEGDGVNLVQGDDFSEYCGKLCQDTYTSSNFVEVLDMSEGHFRGPRGWRFKNLPDGCVITTAPDGIGTKVTLSVTAQNHRYAARDLIAMTRMDITRWGGLGLVFTNVFDVSSLGDTGSETNEMAKEVMCGLHAVARKQGIVLLNGETAELGPLVSSENPDAIIKFNWAGVMVGVYHPKKMVTGSTLRPGQIIVALQEDGFRSNGISAVRQAFRKKFGNEWWKVDGAFPFIRYASEPSVLYDDFLNNVNGWYEDHHHIQMHLISHLSGGGIKSKFAEDIIFRYGLSAVLDDLYNPPNIMQQCFETLELSDEDAYHKWNGGQGALVVINTNDLELFCEVAKRFGLSAKYCGTIKDAASTKGVPTVSIESKFTGKVFSYTKE